jgi:hypothetical protein
MEPAGLPICIRLSPYSPVDLDVDYHCIRELFLSAVRMLSKMCRV